MSDGNMIAELNPAADLPESDAMAFNFLNKAATAIVRASEQAKTLDGIRHTLTAMHDKMADLDKARGETADKLTELTTKYADLDSHAKAQAELIKTLEKEVAITREERDELSGKLTEVIRQRDGWKESHSKLTQEHETALGDLAGARAKLEKHKPQKPHYEAWSEEFQKATDGASFGNEERPEVKEFVEAADSHQDPKDLRPENSELQSSNDTHSSSEVDAYQTVRADTSGRPKLRAKELEDEEFQAMVLKDEELRAKTDTSTHFLCGRLSA
jgi:chromosome segregation ATPase